MSDESRDGLRRSGTIRSFLMKGAAVSFVGRTVAVVAGVAIQALLARLLSPAELGAFLLLQSVVVACARIGQLGLHRTAVRAIAAAAAKNDFDKARGYVLPTLIIALSSGSVVGLAYWLFVGRLLADQIFSSSLMIAALAATACWILALTLQNVVSEVFRGFQDIPSAVIFGGALTSVVIAFLLTIVFLRGNQISLSEAVYISVLGGASSFLLALLFIHGRVSGARKSPARPYRLLMSSALSLTVAGFLSSATAEIDIWIAGAFLDEESVALYGSAKRLIRIVSLPLVIMNLVVPPLIAELHAQGDAKRLQRAVRASASLAGIPALFTLVGLLAAREELLGFVYGDFYRQASAILLLLTVERLAFVWSGPCALTLTMTGQDALMLRMTTIGSILAAAGAAIGAALDGGRGIAIGVASAGIVRHTMMWWAARRACRIRTDVDLSSIAEGYMMLKRMLEHRVPK